MLLDIPRDTPRDASHVTSPSHCDAVPLRIDLPISPGDPFLRREPGGFSVFAWCVTWFPALSYVRSERVMLTSECLIQVQLLQCDSCCLHKDASHDTCSTTAKQAISLAVFTLVMLRQILCASRGTQNLPQHQNYQSRPIFKTVAKLT